MATGIMRASAIMASGTIVSRILGLLKVILLASAIGAVESKSADAFANGNLLPNLVYMVLLGGMLNAVLVPQIVKAARHPDGGAGYINKVLTLVLSGLVVGTALVLVLAPWVVWTVTWDWDADQRALATAFAYWCLPQIIFYGLYTVLGEVLNARSVFGPFTWVPVLNNVVAIAGIVVFMAMFGADPHGDRPPGTWTALQIAVLAGSATLGVVVQAVVLFVSWWRAGIRYRPDFRWRGMGLGETARIAGWSLGMVIVVNVGGWVTRSVVSTASGEGVSAQAMDNAWLLFMMPHSVITVSLATAYFTRLAGWGQNGRISEFRADLSASVRQISLVMVFASVAMFVAAPFISRVMLLGEDLDRVMQLSVAVQCYMLGLAAYSFLFIVQRAFYALSDTRTPFIFTTIQIVVLVVLTLGLLLVPKSALGAGYALLWSLTIVVEALIAVWLLRKRITRIDGRRILSSLWRYAGAALPATVIGYLVFLLSRLVVPDPGALAALGLAAAQVTLTAAVYLLGLRLLRSTELAEVAAVVSRRLGRSRS